MISLQSALPSQVGGRFWKDFLEHYRASRTLALILSILAAGFLWRVVIGLSAPPEMPFAPRNLHCANPPNFQVVYSGGQNYIVVQGGTYFFNSTSWLEADMCSAGTLEVTAHGIVANGAASRLTVSLDSVKLADEPFTAERTWKLSIPTLGRLRLAYLNDYYNPPANRDLIVTNLKFIPQ